jgi:thiamine-phosphate pyrophosphorylase
VEAALELHADGVHLGQGDPGAERARRAGLLLGRSASTLEQALAADADYLGVGPIWETPSKDDAGPAIGLTGLRSICEAVSIPVVAIGGIDALNAGDCIRAGAAGVAVIRAASDPALRQAVDEALGER